MNVSRSIIFGLIVAIILTLGFTAPGEKGIVNVHHLNKELSDLKAENTSLRMGNYNLSQEAFLLKENTEYIEHVIIKEMNMVRPGDIIVMFEKKKN